MIDFDRVMQDRQAELLPLRRWARRRLDRGQPHAIPLDRAGLERLAELCGVTTVDLIGRLRRLHGSTPATASTPPSARRSA